MTEFAAFFRDIWGVDPFPWQARLAAEALDRGALPDLLDLPTGTGKTSAIDIALYLLAQAPEHFPRRIVLVVDRRTIVDQAWRRGLALRDALGDAERRPEARPHAAAVAAALRSLSGPATRPHEPVVDAVVLRGGIPRDDDWARTPCRPVLVSSTVDQVGSRLLFRGYGLSNSMAPVHAGLLGHDTLLLLDEVHLSGPFAETLAALAPRRTAALPDRWQVVSLSATPAGAASWRFGLSDADREHPVLSRRLSARKPTSLQGVPVKGKEAQRRRALAEAIAKSASRDAGPGRALLVVVNRVDTALRCRDALLRDNAKAGWAPVDPAAPQDVGAAPVRVALVTGRMRGIERDRLAGWLAETLAAGRTRDAEAPGLVVVATQCIEAGADLDFDALFTECAALDALRQRAGRVDRVGAVGMSPITVFAREDQQVEHDDPVYGPALAATWQWLATEADGLDLGIGSLPSTAVEVADALRAPSPGPPVLLPAYVDAWVQTSPHPDAEPEPAHFLHGITSPSPEVRLCWRADIDASDLDPERPADLMARLAAVPPSAGELVTVPLHVARTWLSHDEVEDLGSDVEGRGASVEERSRRTEDRFVGVAWYGPDDGRTGLASLSGLRPGAILVLPASAGGLTMGNFDPSAKAPVVDVAERAALSVGRRLLRLHPSVLADLGLPTNPPKPSDPLADDERPAAVVRAWCAPLTGRFPFDGPSASALLRARLVEIGGADGYWVLVARDSPATTDSDDGSFTGRSVPLATHLRGVEGLARAFAAACGLPPDLVEDLALAGRLHDLGKADPRFQLMLHGGDPVRAAAGRLGSIAELRGLLAKSAVASADAGLRERARQRSGYPRGARHELLSVAFAQAEPALLSGASDEELVLHLVAAHHGRCRPLAPVAEDPAPTEVTVGWGGVTVKARTDHGLERLDSGIAERFWRLTRRYGPHGLAALEAILRLADHRRSEQEQAGGA